MTKFEQYLIDSKKILLITSQPLDPDCIASGVIMKKYLEHLGLDVTFRFPKELNHEEIERNKYIPFFNELVHKDTRDLLIEEGFDTLILLDGSSWSQFYDYENGNLPVPASDKIKKIIHIDHHLKGADLGTHEIINSKASSTIEVMLSEIIPDHFLDKELATLAYIGLIGDTGNFRWNFNPKTLEHAAMLLHKGAEPIEAVEVMFAIKKKNYLNMLKYVLDNFEYDDDLQTVFLFLPLEKQISDGVDDIKQKIVKEAFIEEISRNVEGYHRGMFVIENREKGNIKISARGSNLNNRLNFLDLWTNLGGEGGGHFHAASMRIKADFEEFKIKMKHVMKAMLASDT